MATKLKSSDLTDGRVLRAEQNRKEVAQAMLTLLRRGVMQPTRQQVADQANLSLRTVYHHFDNLEALYEEACRIQFESIDPLINHVPETLSDDLHARVVGLMDMRAELYETITPVRRNAMFWIYKSAVLLKGIGMLSEWIREQLAATFEPELKAVKGLQREQVIDALEASTSWDAWDFMRHRKNFSRERAYRAMARSIEAILHDIGTNKR